MKQILLITIMLLVGINSWSQDIIVLNDGTTQEAYFTEVGKHHVFYQINADSVATTNYFSEKLSDVLVIKFANGDKYVPDRKQDNVPGAIMNKSDNQSGNEPSGCLTDYSQLRIGDYYYSDGSFSHGVVTNKKPVGVVFALGTTPFEQRNKLVHGYIMSLENGPESRWCKGQADNLDFYKQQFQKADAFADMDGFKYNCILLQKPEVFLAAKKATEFPAILPKGKTSGWYLPSVGQFYLFIKNLAKVDIDKSGEFDNEIAIKELNKYGFTDDLETDGMRKYWTSVGCTTSQTWILNLKRGHLWPTDLNHKYIIRPVATF